MRGGGLGGRRGHPQEASAEPPASAGSKRAAAGRWLLLLHLPGLGAGVLRRSCQPPVCGAGSVLSGRARVNAAPCALTLGRRGDRRARLCQGAGGPAGREGEGEPWTGPGSSHLPGKGRGGCGESSVPEGDRVPGAGSRALSLCRRVPAAAAASPHRPAVPTAGRQRQTDRHAPPLTGPGRGPGPSVSAGWFCQSPARRGGRRAGTGPGRAGGSGLLWGVRPQLSANTW